MPQAHLRECWAFLTMQTKIPSSTTESILALFDRLFSIGYPAFLLCLQTLLCYWIFPLCLQIFSSHQTLKTKVLLFPQELLYPFCNEPPTPAFSNLTSNPLLGFPQYAFCLTTQLKLPWKRSPVDAWLTNSVEADITSWGTVGGLSGAWVSFS